MCVELALPRGQPNMSRIDVYVVSTPAGTSRIATQHTVSTCTSTLVVAESKSDNEILPRPNSHDHLRCPSTDDDKIRD